MKKSNFIMIAIMFAMILVSCGGEEKKEPSETLDDVVSEYENSSNDEEDDKDVEGQEEVNGNEEWDEILDGYESYIDSYVAIIKKQKADPSDMTIMTEYSELMQKGTEWSTKMASSSSEFGMEQLTRMQAIQAKLANAAL